MAQFPEILGQRAIARSGTWGRLDFSTPLDTMEIERFSKNS